jgi:methionyl aminopeptidase
LSRIRIKTENQQLGIRIASAITAKILDEVGEHVRVGSSTEDINTFVHERTLELGGIPAPLNYKGFPKSVCTSVNDVVCHGIPSQQQVLQDGDLINVDVTTIKDGYFGDASRMYIVGGENAKCSSAARELVSDTYDALMVGIKEVEPGKRFGAIGRSIQDFIEGLKKEYGIVREYTGHGIGLAFHEPPQILHYGGYDGGSKMRPGMIFTIEPMINLGTWHTSLSAIDGWTVRTADGKLSAQWEHTVLVTETGYEILTLSADEKARMAQEE